MLAVAGVTTNTMTLGGLAIAIGEVVDDAIIDVENIQRRLHENLSAARPRPAWQVVLDASLAVALTLTPALACVVAAGVGLYFRLETDFLPEQDEGAFVLDDFTRPGTSLAETDRMLRHVEQILRSTPEIESYSRRTGARLALAIAVIGALCISMVLSLLATPLFYLVLLQLLPVGRSACGAARPSEVEP